MTLIEHKPMKIKTLLLSIAVAGTVFGATRTEAIREKIFSQDRKYVFVAMHRGDWRNYPENSEGAILSSIAVGADIVELDVQRTKDGHFVLNHDKSVDRTTNGKGKVGDLTLEEIKKLKLLGRNGKPSRYGILTLEEALELTRGKILMNIDKFSGHPREILDIVNRAGALKEVLLKGYFSPESAKKTFGPYWQRILSGEILYMPVVQYRPNSKAADGWLGIEPRKGSMYEMCFCDSDHVAPALEKLKAAPLSPRLWVNTLWDSISAGHSDKAALADPDAHWGWWLDRGATMIQSDYVVELIEYLKKKGRRNF